MDHTNRSTIVGGFIALALLIGILGYANHLSNTPGELDTFAKCLTEKKAEFYGAFWCPHCQAQKALFGKSKEFLPYIECSTPDGKGQTKECADKGVKSYPTWFFADGSTQSGEVPLQTLADKTGCILPGVVTTASSTPDGK